MKGMNKGCLRKWMTGVLCTILIFTNVLSAVTYVSAAETGTNALSAEKIPDDNNITDVIEKDGAADVIDEDETFDDVTEEKEDKEENEGENENQSAEGLDEDQDDPQEDVTDTEAPDESGDESEAGEEESGMQDYKDAESQEEESKVSEETVDLENKPMAVANSVASYAMAITQSEAVNWIINQIGRTVGSGQCVALTKAYSQYLAGYQIMGNAKDYATNTPPSGWQKYRVRQFRREM